MSRAEEVARTLCTFYDEPVYGTDRPQASLFVKRAPPTEENVETRSDADAATAADDQESVGAYASREKAAETTRETMPKALKEPEEKDMDVTLLTNDIAPKDTKKVKDIKDEEQMTKRTTRPELDAYSDYF